MPRSRTRSRSESISRLRNWLKSLGSWLGLPNQIRGAGKRRLLVCACLERTSSRFSTLMAADGKTAFPAELFTDVLPRLNPVFENLDRLSSSDVTARRLAAAAILAQLAGRPLSPLELRRLAELMSTEIDPVVWQQALRIVKEDGREAAQRRCSACRRPCLGGRVAGRLANIYCSMQTRGTPGSWRRC